MTTFEKIQFFADKDNGFGISPKVLARYSGYKSSTSISHYLAQDRPTNERQENAFEMGIRKLAQDIVDFINNEG